MKNSLILILILTCLAVEPTRSRGQVSGNVGFSRGGGKARAEQTEKNKRVLTKEELPSSCNGTFVEANVLMNVRADQYVAVFGIMQEGDTLADCSRKMDATITQFSAELKTLGIGGNDLFVDFIAQNKIYGFEVSGDAAREKLVGFELKKNVSIHYMDKALLDKIVVAASRSQVFDLIKVDYIVTDTSGIKNRLMEEAGRVIKHKASQYERLLDIKLVPPGQVYAERPATYFPQEMYDSYTAFENEHIGRTVDRQRLTVHSARKSRTLFFNGLDANGFDVVINPVVTEPVVQFTLYLKVNYEVAPIKAR